MKSYSLVCALAFFLVSTGMQGHCVYYASNGTNDPAKATAPCNCTWYFCISKPSGWKLTSQQKGGGSVKTSSATQPTAAAVCPVCGHALFNHNVDANHNPIDPANSICS